jgi:hypothetical protein
LLGVALAGTVVAEATPIGQVEKLAVTFTLPVPDGVTATWNGTVRVSPVLVLAVSVPLTSSRPLALTIVTLMPKRQTYELFCGCGQGPLVTVMLATADGGGGPEFGDDGAWPGAATTWGKAPEVVAPGLGLAAGVPEDDRDAVVPDAGTAPVGRTDTRGACWSVRSARDGWDGRNR